MKRAIINGIESTFYYVDKGGDIYSIRKDGSFRKLSPYVTHDGYRRVQLAADVPRKHYRMCRIVAETYLANPNDLPMVHHKNSIRLDDRVDNLEWCDNSYNQRERFKVRLSESNKPILQIDIETGDVIRCFLSINAASRELGIQSQNIGKVCRGKRKHAGGYSWSYVDCV